MSVLLLAALVAVTPCQAQEKSGHESAKAQSPAEGDASNPRNHKFDDLEIEYISIDPKVEVEKVGDGPKRPESDESTITVHLKNLRSDQVYAAINWGKAVEKDEVGYIDTGETKVVTKTFKTKDLPYGQNIDALVYNMDVHELQVTDSAPMYEPDAMRTAVLVERKTFDAGEKEFGSFARRMRQSFDDLHELFTKGTAAPCAGLTRESIQDRFRLEDVEVYDSKEGDTPGKTPLFFDNHPKYDLVIACDEKGPLGGFYLPQYSIGHNFWNEQTKKGLWSDWGEQALWHEMLHFRGVPDFYISSIPKGALPGRWNEAIDVPEPFHSDLMNYPYQKPVISALSAAIVNSKKGISRVGPCEDPSLPCGHEWRWLPKTVVVQWLDDNGKPVPNLTVRWYRSMPAGLKDTRVQGVSADQKPEGEAKTDANGKVKITGDYLGATTDSRSLWMLVEVDQPGKTASDQPVRCFDIVYDLWLNAAYAAGQKDEVLWMRKLSEAHEIRPAVVAPKPGQDESSTDHDNTNPFPRTNHDGVIDPVHGDRGGH